MVGIKGTGMAALAELLHQGGAVVSGSDTKEVFYTDGILKSLGIEYHEGFDAGQLPSGAGLVIHSAAYSPETNPELEQARKLGLPLLKYPDALGAYSSYFDSSGIAGVHGKTTTTALAGTLIRAAGLPASVLAGSAVGVFGGRSTLCLGGKYFVAETCEYRRHFLAFHPRRIVLTSVEGDHQDYYPTYESIRDAFVEYVSLLPPGGTLIYCADDSGASETAAIVKRNRNDILFLPYGFSAEGDFGISSIETANERTEFTLAGFPKPFTLRIPGRHLVLDAAAALALTLSLLKTEAQKSAEPSGGTVSGAHLWMPGDGLALAGKKLGSLALALDSFTGSRRRSEILGEAGGILFMDDYGHHPTAIRSTLMGLKEFYPCRRVIVSFMSHTYTRTAALLDEFAASFDSADTVILHKIYSSAREAYTGGVNGKTLFEEVKKKRRDVYYTEEALDALPLLAGILSNGDLFITMGAGDNWVLGKKLFEKYQNDEPGASQRSGL